MAQRNLPAAVLTLYGSGICPHFVGVIAIGVREEPLPVIIRRLKAIDAIYFLQFRRRYIVAELSAAIGILRGGLHRGHRVPDAIPCRIAFHRGGRRTGLVFSGLRFGRLLIHLFLFCHGVFRFGQGLLRSRNQSRFFLRRGGIRHRVKARWQHGKQQRQHHQQHRDPAGPVPAMFLFAADFGMHYLSFLF